MQSIKISSAQIGATIEVRVQFSDELRIRGILSKTEFLEYKNSVPNLTESLGKSILLISSGLNLEAEPEAFLDLLKSRDLKEVDELAKILGISAQELIDTPIEKGVLVVAIWHWQGQQSKIISCIVDIMPKASDAAEIFKTQNTTTPSTILLINGGDAPSIAKTYRVGEDY